MFVIWLVVLVTYGCVRGFDRIDPLAWWLLLPMFFESGRLVTVFVDAKEREEDD